MEDTWDSVSNEDCFGDYSETSFLIISLMCMCVDGVYLKMYVCMMTQLTPVIEIK